MDERILVPVDRSERAHEALEFALKMHPAASVVVLHVVAPAQFYASTSYHFRSMVHNDPPENVEERLDAWGMEVIEEALNGLDVEDRDIERVVLVGEVAALIVEYLESHDVDMVVIGSHGRTGMSRILLGSVAETVARRSPVPVTIFR